MKVELLRIFPGKPKSEVRGFNPNQPREPNGRFASTGGGAGGGSSKKFIDNSDESGIIKSGAVSGALDPDGKEASEHAERYYASVRKMTTDAKHISENTEFTEDEIREIKEHVFIKKHDLGGAIPERFYPDYDMAQSWQRLIDGKNIQPHDITMLNHERMELNLMKRGDSQATAHRKTEEIFNYAMESREYNAKISKHKK